MAYYLYDLYEKYGTAQNRWVGNPMRFNTKDELLAFWHVHCGHTWGNSNVTGNDIIMYLESHYLETTPDGMFLVKYLYAPYLHRYLVTDSDGRHQDIRDWNLDIKPPPRRSNIYGCWKDQSKAGSQYRRHAKASKGWRGQAPQSDNSLWKNLIADGFPVCPGTAEAAA